MRKQFVFVLILIALAAGAASGQKLKPEEIVARHLESIGAEADRAAVKNQMAVGEVEVTYISQKNQSSRGRFIALSEGAKTFFGMKMSAVDYPGEQFGFNGTTAKVGYVRTNLRSPLGTFLASNGFIIRDGVFGGVITRAWTLADIKRTNPKFSRGSTKKIDGRETYAIGYSPKSGGDVDIMMYFDMETFRHVRTEYKRVWSASMGRTINESARQSESRLKVTEDFGDFRSEGKLMLPHSYSVRYSITGQNGTTEVEWKTVFSEFVFDQNLAENSFNVNESN
jgi:hypothetical protein